jgi:hypothetical protein
MSASSGVVRGDDRKPDRVEAASVGGLFHCPSRFQITARAAISSMHKMTRRPMRQNSVPALEPRNSLHVLIDENSEQRQDMGDGRG